LRDVAELAEIQKRLLGLAASSVKPGGKLVYAVCTLTCSETTSVVEDFNAKSNTEFEPMVLPNLNETLPSNTATMTIWPQDLEGNGMFVAAWQRRKA
jgi:16S rRNA (cytosine967-C5)-methyltransferase